MIFAADLSASTLMESFGFLVAAALVLRLTVGVLMRGAAGSGLAVAVPHATWTPAAVRTASSTSCCPAASRC